ncbi:MAG: HlyD family efflux transporter periplasmic adaptor subunit [Saprospiraceae bacterium]|nr:HlyD family efflux transporter periplasmic adaptor subunit [Saprospiraceae bacterium]
MASKKRKWWILILIVAVLALVAMAIMKARSKPKGVEVQMEESEARTIDEKVSASGKVFPETEVKISSDVSGEIVELYVEEGDSVIMGQVLAKIDPDTYISAVERGEASLNNSKANLATSQAQINNSDAQVEQIQAQLANAEAVHTRNIDLKKNGVISQVEFDQSLANLDGLKANLRASKAGLESSKKSAEAAKYMVKSMEASLNELKTSLNRTTISAPTSGVVSSLSVEKGERVVGTIQMAGTEMMRIANLNNMEVQVDVSENDILRVSMGDSVDIEVDAYLDKIFKGTVTEIANSASNIATAQASLNSDQVTNFIVKIRIDPDSYASMISSINQYPFRPGMSATVDIYTESERDKVTIPIQAVTVRDLDKEDREEKFEEVVFIVEADTVRQAKVVTGIQDDEYIVVKEGVEIGETVVTGPYSTISKTLKEGDQVRKKEEFGAKKDE